jgi:hypothetical protein
MPLTPSGNKVIGKLQGEYGDKKGTSVFYAMLNSRKLDRSKMEGSSKKSPLLEAIKRGR